MNIFGIDVSHYNNAIDWPQVKAGGKTFAFAKATEGKSYADAMFQTNMVNGAFLLTGVSCLRDSGAMQC